MSASGSDGDRVAMVAADGTPLGWTYDARRYDEVRTRTLEAFDVLPSGDGSLALQAIVGFVQDALAEHELFPSGRLTNAVRYVAADLQGRGQLERVGRGSPQRLRRCI